MEHSAASSAVTKRPRVLQRRREDTAGAARRQRLRSKPSQAAPAAAAAPCHDPAQQQPHPRNTAATTARPPLTRTRSARGSAALHSMEHEATSASVFALCASTAAAEHRAASAGELRLPAQDNGSGSDSDDDDRDDGGGDVATDLGPPANAHVFARSRVSRQSFLDPTGATLAAIGTHAGNKEAPAGALFSRRRRLRALNASTAPLSATQLRDAQHRAALAAEEGIALHRKLLAERTVGRSQLNERLDRKAFEAELTKSRRTFAEASAAVDSFRQAGHLLKNPVVVEHADLGRETRLWEQASKTLRASAEIALDGDLDGPPSGPKPLPPAWHSRADTYVSRRREIEVEHNRVDQAREHARLAAKAAAAAADITQDMAHKLDANGASMSFEARVSSRKKLMKLKERSAELRKGECAARRRRGCCCSPPFLAHQPPAPSSQTPPPPTPRCLAWPRSAASLWRRTRSRARPRTSGRSWCGSSGCRSRPATRTSGGATTARSARATSRRTTGGRPSRTPQSSGR